eukprot:4347264-Prymnesium_polylepis.1
MSWSSSCAVRSCLARRVALKVERLTMNWPMRTSLGSCGPPTRRAGEDTGEYRDGGGQGRGQERGRTRESTGTREDRDEGGQGRGSRGGGECG